MVRKMNCEWLEAKRHACRKCYGMEIVLSIEENFNGAYGEEILLLNMERSSSILINSLKSAF